MGWARIDDSFHDHPKLIGLSLEALGLWVKCLTWAHRHHGSGTPMGHIPPELPQMFAGSRGKKLSEELSARALWDRDLDLGGWNIHDYIDYLPAAERPSTASDVSKARSEAGKRGAAARWDKANESQADSKLPSDDMASTDGKPMPPNPTRPDEETSSSGIDIPDQDLPREDIESICLRLADAIEANGSKRPNIGKTWRTEARLLLDRDKRTVEQVNAAIDWCQASNFWRGNILSMPTLREKYDQLRLAAQREAEQPKNGHNVRGPKEIPGVPGRGMAMQL